MSTAISFSSVPSGSSSSLIYRVEPQTQNQQTVSSDLIQSSLSSRSTQYSPLLTPERVLSLSPQQTSPLGVRLKECAGAACELQNKYEPDQKSLGEHLKAMEELGRRYLPSATGPKDPNLAIYAAAIQCYCTNFAQKQSLCSQFFPSEVESTLIKTLGLSERQLHSSDYFKGLRNQLAKIRGDVKKRFDERGPIDAIHLLWHQRFQSFFSDIIKDAENTLGSPPCKYTAFGLGSYGRGEMTPFSDIEFGFFTDGKTSNEEVREYFRKLTYLIHFQILQLGETMLPCIGIPALRDSDFYDSTTLRGISFDGQVSHACKTPHGKKDQNGRQVYELIRTPEELIQQLFSKNEKEEYFFQNETSLALALLSIQSINGEKNLVEKFQILLLEKIQQLNISHLILEALMKDIEDKGFHFHERERGSFVKLKHELYKVPQIAVSILGMHHKISAGPTLQKIEELAKNKHISKDVEKILKGFFLDIMHWRLQVYLHYGMQKEEMDYLAKENSVSGSTLPQEPPKMDRYKLRDLLILSERFFRTARKNIEQDCNIKDLEPIAQLMEMEIDQRVGLYVDAQIKSEIDSNKESSQPCDLIIDCSGVTPNVLISIDPKIQKNIESLEQVSVSAFSYIYMKKYPDAEKAFKKAELIVSQLVKQAIKKKDEKFEELIKKGIRRHWLDSRASEILRGQFITYLESKQFKECEKMIEPMILACRAIWDYCDKNLDGEYTKEDLCTVQTDLALAYSLKAQYQLAKTEFEQAQKTYEEALKWAEGTSKKQDILTKYERSKDYTLGNQTEHFEQSVKEKEKMFRKESPEYFKDIIDLAGSYRRGGNPEKSVSTLQKIFPVISNKEVDSQLKIGFWMEYALSLSKECMQIRDLTEKERVINLISKAYEKACAIPKASSVVFGNAARWYQAQRKYPQAREKAERWLDVATQESLTPQKEKAKEFLKNILSIKKMKRTDP